MEDFENRFVEKCDLYIQEASDQTNFDEEMLSLITGIIPLLDEAAKKQEKQKRKKLNSLKYEYTNQKKIATFLAYVNFFQVDIFTSLKYLCISKNEIEKKYFIKQAYAYVYEFLQILKSDNTVVLSKEIEKISNDDFLSLTIMTKEMEKFSNTENYKLMETVRNKISNHYDDDALLYINLLKQLEEIEAVGEITKVFHLIKYCKDFNQILMPILANKIENNNQILKEINA